ncbi:tumor suppressor candidate 3-like [Oscarella lobularis]|uniref:tumor suppressor candidate 3-like n=1 Tax=Oscarella lobularis TaxID=121494 RepID=UPI003313192D
MWRLSLAILLLASAATAAKKSSGAKKDTSKIDAKVRQLVDWNNRKAIIRLNGDKFREYVKNPPRNYSIIVMLTALQPQRQCQICKQADDEYSIVANSWRFSGSYSPRLFFAMVDFDEGPDVFQALKLNSAPMFIHFPAKGKNKRQDTMDLQRVGFSADAIAKFVAERTGIQITVVRPPNYTVPLLILLALGVIGLLAYFTRIDMSFLYNTTNWGYIALCVIFAMSSGQMWNQIRGPPFAHRDPNSGQTVYIHSSSQFQFVAESYIIMALHAGISLGWIFLTEVSPQARDGRTKKITSMVGLLLVVGVFSVLLAIFRSKYGGYPYRFLL